MPRQIVTNYSFNPQARTVTLTGLDTVDKTQIVSIKNVTLNELLYLAADARKTTLEGKVLTLPLGSVSLQSRPTDELHIVYGFAAPPGGGGGGGGASLEEIEAMLDSRIQGIEQVVEDQRVLAQTAASNADTARGAAVTARNDAVAARDETVIATPARVDWSGAVSLSGAAVASPKWIKARLTGNTVVTLGAGTAGKGYTVTLEPIQDATGGRTLSISGLAWGQGTAPVLTPSPNSRDLIHLVWTGSDWIGLVGGQAIGIVSGGGA